MYYRLTTQEGRIAFDSDVRSYVEDLMSDWEPEYVIRLDEREAIALVSEAVFDSVAVDDREEAEARIYDIVRDVLAREKAALIDSA